MKQYFLMFTLLVLFSCSESSSSVSEKRKAQSNETLVTEVEGMVCSMGCGGSIRKDLKSTGAVSRVEVDFDEEKEKQTVKISYDNSLITQKEIVQRIEKLNKGQFKVNIIGSTSIDNNSKKQSKSESPNVNVAEKSIELPNLLDILSSIVVL